MVSLSRLALAVTLSFTALFSGVAADLKITSPGGPDLWWVGGSQNVLVWTCNDSSYTSFTVLLANKDPKILVAPIAIIAIVNNYDCSKAITKDQANQPPGTGYTVQLADIFNSTHIYAESQPFEIKPLGSAYPTTTVTTATATGTNAAPTATKTGGTLGMFRPSFALGAAFAAAALGISTA
jgi:hypothetical protein